MGCVQSHENKHQINQPQNKRFQQPQRTRHAPLPNNLTANPKPLLTNHINGGCGSEVKRSSAVNSRENNEKSGDVSGLSSGGGASDPQDGPFRRQSFDRNSVLRQSKKRTRKNSTASTSTSTPTKAATANGSASVTTLTTTSPRNVKLQPASMPQTKDVNAFSLDSSAPLEASLEPTSILQQPVKKTDDHIPVSSYSNNSLNETSASNCRGSTVTTTLTQSQGAFEPPQRGDFSASANVAALLGIKADEVTSEAAATAALTSTSEEEEQPQPQRSPPSSWAPLSNSTVASLEAAIHSRSSTSNNGFSMMSANESNDMIKRSTAPTTHIAAIKTRRTSAPPTPSGASTEAASNNLNSLGGHGHNKTASDYRNRKSRKTSAPNPPVPPPRATTTVMSSTASMPASTASMPASNSLRTRREAMAAASAASEREREAHVEEEDEDCGRLI